jgi:hypothetical protein
MVGVHTQIQNVKKEIEVSSNHCYVAVCHHYIYWGLLN